jgi:YgiT-type zinc finger domain-containing protein
MSILDNLALMMVPIIVVVLAVYSIGGLGILGHYLIERYKKRKHRDLSNTRCPICGKGILVKKHIVEAFEYENDAITIPDYIVYECMSCGEAIVDKETLKTSGELIREMYKGE